MSEKIEKLEDENKDLKHIVGEQQLLIRRLQGTVEVLMNALNELGDKDNNAQTED